MTHTHFDLLTESSALFQYFLRTYCKLSWIKAKNFSLDEDKVVDRETGTEHLKTATEHLKLTFQMSWKVYVSKECGVRLILTRWYIHIAQRSSSINTHRIWKTKRRTGWPTTIVLGHMVYKKDSYVVLIEKGVVHFFAIRHHLTLCDGGLSVLCHLRCFHPCDIAGESLALMLNGWRMSAAVSFRFFQWLNASRLHFSFSAALCFSVNLNTSRAGTLTPNCKVQNEPGKTDIIHKTNTFSLSIRKRL